LVRAKEEQITLQATLTKREQYIEELEEDLVRATDEVREARSEGAVTASAVFAAKEAGRPLASLVSTPATTPAQTPAQTPSRAPPELEVSMSDDDSDGGLLSPGPDALDAVHMASPAVLMERLNVDEESSEDERIYAPVAHRPPPKPPPSPDDDAASERQRASMSARVAAARARAGRGAGLDPVRRRVGPFRKTMRVARSPPASPGGIAVEEEDGLWKRATSPGIPSYSSAAPRIVNPSREHF
jgi:hypothetical protein